MKLIPIGSKVVVRPLNKEEKEKYQNNKLADDDATKQGVVMWFGELPDGLSNPLEKGQIIIYKAGDEELIKLNNEKYFVVKYSDLLVILKE